MDFQVLQRRLLAHLRGRVRSGEITERRLARLTGLSQPHLHNVLKGARFLSMEMADQIIERLRLDLFKLPAEGEKESETRETESGRRVPLLEGMIGPGHAYPRRESGGQAYCFEAKDVRGLQSPVAARLIADPWMVGWLGRGGVALLDRSEAQRSDVDEDSYYALDLGEESAVRRVVCAGRRLYLRPEGRAGETGDWPSISLAERPLLEVVKARAALLVLRL